LKDADSCPNGIAIGFCANEMETNGVISGRLIVAIEISGAVICREQHIDVTVAIKISAGEAAADFCGLEATRDLGSDVAKFGFAGIQEKLGSLCVAGVAANVADGVVDVAIGDEQIE